MRVLLGIIYESANRRLGHHAVEHEVSDGLLADLPQARGLAINGEVTDQIILVPFLTDLERGNPVPLNFHAVIVELNPDVRSGIEIAGDLQEVVGALNVVLPMTAFIFREVVETGYIMFDGRGDLVERAKDGALRPRLDPVRPPLSFLVHDEIIRKCQIPCNRALTPTPIYGTSAASERPSSRVPPLAAPSRPAPVGTFVYNSPDFTLSEVMEFVKNSAEVMERFLAEYEGKIAPENFDQLELTDKLVYLMAVAIANQSRALTLMEQQMRQNKNGG